MVGEHIAFAKLLDFDDSVTHAGLDCIRERALHAAEVRNANPEENNHEAG